MKVSNFKFQILFFLIIIGAFLRFYKLDWGNGLYTHPDEYHIVSSVNQLSFPNQMHPHFFSYGTVTIYLIYFTKEFFSLFPQLSSPNLFLIGRFYSALFSIATIFIVYNIAKVFLSNRYAMLAAFLVAITPGLIQQAHFTTPESNLIFFLLTSLLFLLYSLQQTKKRYLFYSALFFGFALGVKISSIVFLLPFITGIVLQSFKKPLYTLFLMTTSGVVILTTLAIAAPFVFLDFPAFWGNVSYEGNLAAGKIPVFYTRQFINTIPVLFQVEKIFPYALGIPLFVVGAFGFLFFVLQAHKKMYLIILLAFVALFIPHAFLFTKWSRFIAPTFSFFSLFAAYFLFIITKKQKHPGAILTFLLCTLTLFWTFAFFSIYTRPDVRITASSWIENNVKHTSTIAVEKGNMIDIPLQGNFYRPGLDLYSLEENKSTQEEVATVLEKADYFLVQSRRVFLNHQKARKEFPKTAHFYDLLFAGDLGFTQIKEFHSYPKISIGTFSIEFPDEQAEETWSVFDHPVIRVFKKTNTLSKEEYEKLFGI